MNVNRIIKAGLITSLTCSMIVSCAHQKKNELFIPSSNLASGPTTGGMKDENDYSRETNDLQRPQFTQLSSLPRTEMVQMTQQDLSSRFSAEDQVEVSADAMPLKAFVHTLFDEILGVSYIIAEDLVQPDTPVTLNLKEAVSSRQLMSLALQVLEKQKIGVTYKDDVYFVHPLQGTEKTNTAIGFGRKVSDVPTIQGKIIQVVPVKYATNPGFENTLQQLITAGIQTDQEQNLYYFSGERAEIIRALELLSVLDTPAMRGKHVALLNLTYIDPDEFVKKITLLLESEGLAADNGKPGRRNMFMLPIEHIGAIALFASDEVYMERVKFWASQIDQPSVTETKRYFVYHPRYSRAADLGESIAGLLNGSGIANAAKNQQGNQQRDTKTAQAINDNQQRATGTSSVSTKDMFMTVDERSNSVIFYTTGKSYQELVPMIKRLDVMPKQILLEATIAEVLMTDEFAMGLEFALKSGKFSIGTMGAYGVSDFGGISLSYVNGLDKVIAQLQASDSRVKVLSNPSLVVRDGVTASIDIGTDVPTVGSTTVNPGTETSSTTVQYRKTGVNFAVTPNVNAQGLVLLQISQNISNTTDAGPTVAGSPSFFERNLKTEVIAESGQTILLGGLISENVNDSQSHTPGLSSLPLLGALFKGQKTSKQRTELVILITARIIEEPGSWQDIRAKLEQGFQSLTLADN